MHSVARSLITTVTSQSAVPATSRAAGVPCLFTRAFAKAKQKKNNNKNKKKKKAVPVFTIKRAKVPTYPTFPKKRPGVNFAQEAKQARWMFDLHEGPIPVVDAGKVQAEFDHVLEAAVLSDHARRLGLFPPSAHGADVEDPNQFIPSLPLFAQYADEKVHPARYIAPSNTITPPHVEWVSDSGKMWTLALVDTRGPFTEHTLRLHWLVGNIPGCAVTEGETLASYIQAAPARALPAYSYAFVLFEQVDGKVNFASDAQIRDNDAGSRERYSLAHFASQYNLEPKGFTSFRTFYDESCAFAHRSALLSPLEKGSFYQTMHSYFNAEPEFTWLPPEKPGIIGFNKPRLVRTTDTAVAFGTAVDDEVIDDASGLYESEEDKELSQQFSATLNKLHDGVTITADEDQAMCEAYVEALQGDRSAANKA